MAPFFQRCVKKWSTFPKRVSKSDTPSKARKIIIKKGVPKSGALFQKVCQKVAYFFKKCVKK
ncbi:MAG: hypothetical protein BHV88_02280 [Clostridiales bacterium 41_12_two_minus]|nr:MAG: hypothetical protein BHV88_02280 [Clostridiales bacterium 41_12_two_minus]